MWVSSRRFVARSMTISQNSRPKQLLPMNQPCVDAYTGLVYKLSYTGIYAEGLFFAPLTGANIEVLMRKNKFRLRDADACLTYTMLASTETGTIDVIGVVAYTLGRSSEVT